MEKIKVASLFCGCGGMDLGLIGGFSYLDKEYKKHPFEIVYSIDNDPYCSQIYNANFKHKCLIKDVREINISEMPDFDMLIGGFPCQSFSISAQNPPRLGYKDERGMLFFEMVKILQKRQPRFFIAENVKGLLSANEGKAFPMILNEFQSAGYKVVYKLFNAYDYGVPQKRERVIMIGFRDEIDVTKYHFPIHVRRSDRKILKDVILDEANYDESLFFSNRAVAGMMAVREKMNKGRVMKLDEPCNTISAHLAKISLNSTDPVFMVGNRYRRFSTREAARIQSFPDSFVLDLVSQSRQYKAIGNAVPPVMMWNIVKPFYNVLKVPTLDLCKIKQQNPCGVVFNKQRTEGIEVDKNVLISYVKNDTIQLFLDGTVNVYYTGKRFPSTIALNKLYYFMPYKKGKGIRDLYFIKIARVGSKQEVHPECEANDFRLVFELEFVKQLFDDFKLIDLPIWHTFKDTTIHLLLKDMESKQNE